jgi:hypothetical protein
MLIHRYLYFSLGALCLLLILSGVARAELPVATGEHWTTATEREKKAFLLGMGTMIKVEHEIQGDAPPPDDKTFIPTLVKGLSKFTLTSAMEAIDGWPPRSKSRAATGCARSSTCSRPSAPSRVTPAGSPRLAGRTAGSR